VILSGDCLDVMARLDAESVDSVVTDPPYGLKFMGKTWDHGVPGAPFWAAALRVARPGSYLLAFGGTRTWHRLACAVEDAGWEMRDTLCWLYGSGFPKGRRCLKPAWEPVIMARKKGPGELQVEACRLDTAPSVPGTVTPCVSPNDGRGSGMSLLGSSRDRQIAYAANPPSGRWPANVCLDEEAAGMLDEEAGAVGGGFGTRGDHSGGITDIMRGEERTPGLVVGFGDSGGPSRFYYCAKASRSEREAGLREAAIRSTMGVRGGQEDDLSDGKGRSVPAANHHPTVKPLSLMRWLCRLVTPPGGTVLDPFAGSGTTGCAAEMEGFKFIGIEREAEYVKIAEARIAHWGAQPALPMAAPPT